MNNNLIQQQLEFQGSDQESVELDKMLLRIFENPSIQSYLCNIGERDGKMEFDFLDLPHKAIDAVKRLIGPTEIEVLSYNVHSRPHIGFRFDLKPLAALSIESPSSVRQ
jgi:hypothetical protein